MSQTSTNLDKYTTSPRNSSKESAGRTRSSFEGYKIGQGRRPRQQEKWSDNKVLDELSSFIAEFSYLTNKASQKEEKKVQQELLPTYTLYPAETSGTPFAKHSSAKKKSKKSREVKPTKSVEWIDEKQTSVSSRKPQKTTPKRHFTDTTNTSTGGKSRSPDSTKPRYISKGQRSRPQSDGFRSRPRVSRKSAKSRSKRISPSKKRSHSRYDYKSPRPRSSTKRAPMKFKIDQKHRRSRSHRQRPRSSQAHHDSFKCNKSRSGLSGIKITPIRHRRRSRTRSGSWKRDLPFKYERKKERPVVIKRRRSIPIFPKREIKEGVPSESATLITLYPGIRPKQQILSKYDPKYHYSHKKLSKYDPEFLTDTALPCKCFECMRKYKSLIQLPLPKKIHPISNLFEGLGKGTQTAQSMACVHQPRFQQDTQLLRAAPFQCGYHFTPECDEIGDMNSKSVYFKFDCYGHHIDSTITQYFHSILSKSI